MESTFIHGFDQMRGDFSRFRAFALKKFCYQPWRDNSASLCVCTRHAHAAHAHSR